MKNLQRDAVRIVLVMGVLVGSLSCRERARTSATEDEAAPAQDAVLLSGQFESIGKSGAGSVFIERKSGKVQLRLRGLELEPAPELRVYLVGLPQVRTSADVDAAENKYDMAAYTDAEQVIELPSEPEKSVRSVVIWNAKYRAALISASLSPPAEP